MNGIAHSYHCPDEQVRRFRGCPSSARGIQGRGWHRYMRIHRYVATVVVLELRFMAMHSIGKEEEAVSWYACDTHAAIRCLHPLETRAESLGPLGIQLPLPPTPSPNSINPKIHASFTWPEHLVIVREMLHLTDRVANVYRILATHSRFNDKDDTPFAFRKRQPAYASWPMNRPMSIIQIHTEPTK